MNVVNPYETLTLSFKTLTPLHIGSGEQLVNGVDFYYDKSTQKIHKIRPETVLEVIGENQVAQWTNLVSEGKNIFVELPMLKDRMNQAEQLSYETLPVDPTVNEIKKEYYFEFIRNKLTGNPIIPGSTIKGAIRTAYIRKFILKNEEFKKYFIQQLERFKSAYEREQNNRKKKNLIRGFENQIETAVFELITNDFRLNKKDRKKRVQKDIFKFIQIADVELDINALYVLNFQTLDYFRKGWDIKHSLTQTKEVIEASGEIRIKIDKRFWEKNTLDLKKVDDLFNLIHEHFKKLTEFEYDDFKKDLKTNKFSDMELGSQIVESLKEINKDENQIIIRMASGSGWNFMTGRWAKDIIPENNDDDVEWDFLVDNLLRHQRRAAIFPKTRRITSTNTFPGFISLKIKRS